MAAIVLAFAYMHFHLPSAVNGGAGGAGMREFLFSRFMLHIIHYSLIASIVFNVNFCKVFLAQGLYICGLLLLSVFSLLVAIVWALLARVKYFISSKINGL